MAAEPYADPSAAAVTATTASSSPFSGPLSRYRSLRKKKSDSVVTSTRASAAPSHSSVKRSPSLDAHSGDASSAPVHRSMSRYHRARPNAGAGGDANGGGSGGGMYNGATPYEQEYRANQMNYKYGNGNGNGYGHSNGNGATSPQYGGRNGGGDDSGYGSPYEQQQQQHYNPLSPHRSRTTSARPGGGGGPPNGGGGPPRGPARQNTMPDYPSDNPYDSYNSAPHRSRTNPSRPGGAMSPTNMIDDRAQARQLLASEAERQERLKARLRAERTAQREQQEAEFRAQQQQQDWEAEQATKRRHEQMQWEAQEAERRRQQRQQWDEEEAERRRVEREKEEKRQRDENESRERRERLQQRDRDASAPSPGGARRANTHQEDSVSKGGSSSRLAKAGSFSDILHGGPRSAAARSGTGRTSPVPSTRSTVGFLSLFKRKKGPTSQKSSEQLRAPAVQSPNSDKRKFIKPGGGGVVPGTDAPVSAVNAGDRRVAVEFSKSRITLPVRPETTPQDLVRSAEICMSEPIDYSRAFLLEYFSKVGLQRPLRKYERVRDVLNSWDDDNSNSLVIMHASNAAANEISVESVPRTRPTGEQGWPMMYSSKPGTWEKRWVALQPDGQMTLAKNDSGKGKVNACHLSDFDIYTPTLAKLKKVKPPKKNCYAIKSQQKSTMFQEVSSFVHFFSTSDTDAANAFYRAVQGWRSWYLVNVMGEGEKRKTAPPPPVPEKDLKFGAKDAPAVPALPGSLHQRRPSLESHYRLGSFKPLDLSADQFAAGGLQPFTPGSIGSLTPYAETPAKEFPPDAAAKVQQYDRKESVRNRAPPSAFNASYRNQFNGDRPATAGQQSSSGAERDYFSSSGQGNGGGGGGGGGGLGRTSSQRGRGSFDSAAGAGGSGLQRQTSLRSQRNGGYSGADSSDVNRAKSVRANQPPKPLVDLTPQYKEPPQFAKKGKGFRGPVGPGGLVESATTQHQDFIAIPPSQDWRGRNVAGDSGRGYGGAGIDFPRSGSLRGHGVRVHGNNSGGGGGDRGGGGGGGGGDGAFTGQGLLAGSQAQNSWGDGGQGRPHVSSNQRRGGPLLDMSQESRFQQGSLLANVEQTGRGGGSGWDNRI